MSIFGKQLQNRILTDDLLEEVNLKRLGDAAIGKKKAHYEESTVSLENIRQIEMICHFLGLQVPEKIRACDSVEDQIRFMLQPSGATKRVVELNETWWKNGDGPLLAMLKATGEYLALIPNRFRGYHYIDPKNGQKVPVTKKNKDIFADQAVCFYKPLPNTSMTGRDYVIFLLKQLKSSDLLIMLVASVIAALNSTLVPFVTSYAFTYVVPYGKMDLLISLGVLLFSAALSSWIMGVVKSSVNSRISNRLDVVSENAVYARLLRLPASFFGDKSSGGLAQKVLALNNIPSIIIDLMFGTLLSVLISVIYILQLLTIAPPLTLPVFVIYIAELVLFAITVLQERKIVLQGLAAGEKNSGLVFALLSGIQKIKASGNEQRAFTKWMETYTQKIEPTYKIRFPYSMRAPLITAIHMFGMLWIYVIAYQNRVSLAEFTAFSSAFGMVMGGISALSGSGTSFSTFRPILELGEPILREVPEDSYGQRSVTSLSGLINIDQVVFRYTPDSPAILDNISLQIDPGEYVAIVGRSGCGKSTLLKVLIGFEQPEQGSVYYDRYDLGSLDKHSLRRNIGTVLQEGTLFYGDIYSNITITAPWLDEDAAWEAAEKAGMAEDIRRMPMGMHTMISEGGGGISGGQKQRLMIARAICPKPSILMMDEATSALDNLTQKIVTDSLNQMTCTRIIIAHRLSTIQQCDRIIVLDQGKIAEDGTYEELLAKNGIFTELARRQFIEEALE